eukprot:c353_g1_i1.p1 GENE.c353_g1_i1~~c353_g1_i1.p1  ORF type:complete len:419 (+),score=94.28 c353_g1_i1:95-1258(+)
MSTLAKSMSLIPKQPSLTARSIHRHMDGHMTEMQHRVSRLADIVQRSKFKFEETIRNVVPAQNSFELYPTSPIAVTTTLPQVVSSPPARFPIQITSPTLPRANLDHLVVVAQHSALQPDTVEPQPKQKRFTRKKRTRAFTDDISSTQNQQNISSSHPSSDSVFSEGPFGADSPDSPTTDLIQPNLLTSTATTVVSSTSTNTSPKPASSSAATSTTSAAVVQPPVKPVLQCQGMNRKKRIRCRNPALMEYIGPRPLYCAEHISLDSNCLYHKCPSAYQKTPGDGKKCKEVILKEFGRCFKHFGDWLATDFCGQSAHTKTTSALIRVREIITQLETEASLAKSEDSELYQRKTKLVPKYQSMAASLAAHAMMLESRLPYTLRPHEPFVV